MGFDAHVLKVLIAPPGDTGRERHAIETALHGSNSSRAERRRSMSGPSRMRCAVPAEVRSGAWIVHPKSRPHRRYRQRG